MRLLSILVLSAFLGQDHVSDRGIAPPVGELRNITLDDVRPNLDVKHEMWSYRFMLDGGVQLYIDFRRADLGTFKGKVLGANFSVTGFNDQEFAVAREYPTENLVFDEATDRLNFHPKIWFEGRLPGTHRLHYSTRKKGVSYFADLTFSQIERGFVWGDGVFRFDDDDIMGVSIPIPYARVSGKIAINGDTLNVSGTGYMDHVFQSDRVSSLIDSGYRIISHDRGWEVGLFFRPRDKFDASVIGYGGFNMGAGAALYRPTDMSIADWGRVDGKKVPRRILLTDAKGRQRVLERSKNLQKLSLLREVGGVKKFFAKRIAGGDILMYRGVGTINVNRPMAYDFFIVD